MWLAYINGLGIGLGLIVAIGAQNAYLLSQGLKRQHRFTLALTCSLLDCLLIALGVAGLGVFVQLHPTLSIVAKWLGALFLLWYGFKSFRAALQRQTLEADQTHQQPRSIWQEVLFVSALTLLNPHVYVDAVVLLGSISTQFHGMGRFYFGFGAVSASFLWFFSLVYAAGFLSPIFRKPRAWQVLDVMVGCIMWCIAIALIWPTA